MKILIVLLTILVIIMLPFVVLAVYVACPKKHMLESSWEAESKLPIL